jgi:purine/pyrimidine-nucleoside phosphorylase
MYTHLPDRPPGLSIARSCQQGRRSIDVANQIPERFENVTAVCKANVYFDGKVVSHTVLLADGSRKTIGLIYQGTYKFNTGAPERMELVAGACRVRIAGHTLWTDYATGTYFDVPGDSAFEITVESGIMEYVCSFG